MQFLDKIHTVFTATLSRKLVFFANRNTQKNMQFLDKIHTVFTATLISKQAWWVAIDLLVV